MKYMYLSLCDTEGQMVNISTFHSTWVDNVWNQHKRHLHKNDIIAVNCISCLYMCMQNKMMLLYVIKGNAHENLHENVIVNYFVLLTKLLAFNVLFTKMLGRRCMYVTKAQKMLPDPMIRNLLLRKYWFQHK